MYDGGMVCAVGRGENWMKHGSADAVCSFQATGLCNLFANPGYYGTTGSLRRFGAAMPGPSFVKRYFACAEENNEVPSRQETNVFLANNKVSQ